MWTPDSEACRKTLLFLMLLPPFSRLLYNPSPQVITPAGSLTPSRRYGLMARTSIRISCYGCSGHLFISFRSDKEMPNQTVLQNSHPFYFLLSRVSSVKSLLVVWLPVEQSDDKHSWRSETQQSVSLRLKIHWHFQRLSLMYPKKKKETWTLEQIKYIKKESLVLKLFQKKAQQEWKL